MRIGVDATCWQNRRGYGRHLRALLGALVDCDRNNHYTFFVDSPENLATIPSTVDLRIVPTKKATVVAAAANGSRSLHDMWLMSRALSQPSFDLLLFPTVYSYVPVFSTAKKVVIIHDVIAEKFSQLTFPTRRARFFWQAKVAISLHQANAIVTVSDYSRRGLADHFKLDPAKLFVVGEASDPVFRRLDQRQPSARLLELGINAQSRAIVYVGGFAPHKNLTMLVDVFAALSHCPDFADVRLVLVGEYQKEVFHSYFETVCRRVADLTLADRVVFTGYLPDEELVVLLNLATVLVLPSLIEGFGLPAVEAAACGCPVIATTESPLPGLLADGGLYIDPTQPAELEAALKRVLSVPALRTAMRQAGLAATAGLTWNAAAQQLLNLLHKVGGA